MINIITLISVIVIAFVTMAMITILSVFNGIDELVDDLYSSFDADIIISPARGKVMANDSISIKDIEGLATVKSVNEIVEENVLLTFGDQQRIATLKGVPTGYMAQKNMRKNIIEGSDVLADEESEWAVLGYGIKQDLDAELFSQGMRPLVVYAPQRGKKISRHKERAFRSEPIMVGGTFSINVEYDSKYVLSSLLFARDMLDYRNEYNYLEVELKDGLEPEQTKQAIMAQLGDKFKVVTRADKNAMIYKANESERLVTILILSFIIVIAIFNILASLTMLILDKRKDIGTLHSMGATEGVIRKIFFLEGVMISASGTVIGLTLGFIFSYIQQHYGIIRLQGGIVDYYPVVINLKDFFLVAGIVVGIALMFSWFPVKLLTKRVMNA